MRHDWLVCVVVRDRELEHSGQCEKRRSMHLSMCARPNMARGAVPTSLVWLAFRAWRDGLSPQGVALNTAQVIRTSASAPRGCSVDGPRVRGKIPGGGYMQVAKRAAEEETEAERSRSRRLWRNGCPLRCPLRAHEAKHTQTHTSMYAQKRISGSSSGSSGSCSSSFSSPSSPSRSPSSSSSPSSSTSRSSTCSSSLTPPTNTHTQTGIMPGTHRTELQRAVADHPAQCALLHGRRLMAVATAGAVAAA